MNTVGINKMNKTSSKLTNFTCSFLIIFRRLAVMNRPVSLSLLASVISPSKINLFGAPAYGIGKLHIQQLLQRLINLSPCEDKVFFVEVSFPDIHDGTHPISVYDQVCNQGVSSRLRNNFL